MRCSFTVGRLTDKRAKFIPRSRSQSQSTLGQTCTEKHTQQYSAKGSGTSRRQHPVPAQWPLCHKGRLGFSTAWLPAWDLNASPADLWPQVFVFCFGNVSPLSAPPSTPRSPLFLHLKWSAEGVLGTWLAAPLTAPPAPAPPPPSPLPPPGPRTHLRPSSIDPWNSYPTD